jgi:hypothetical protein
VSAYLDARKPNVTNLAAIYEPNDNRFKVTWTNPDDTNLKTFKIFHKKNGGSETSVDVYAQRNIVAPAVPYFYITGVARGDGYTLRTETENYSGMIGTPATIEVTAKSGVRYVKYNSQGTGDGSSWDNASDDLQAMIDEAYEMEHDFGQRGVVYVASQGGGDFYPKYKPGANGQSVLAENSKDAAFILRDGVEIYGGYNNGLSGEMTSTQETERNGAITNTNNYSVLNGLGSSIYAYHVVLGVDVGSDTVLDGFTICNGQANAAGTLPVNQGQGNRNIEKNSGGGMYNAFSSPTLKNILIRSNSVGVSGIAGYGGGMYNYSSSPTLTNVEIVYCEAYSGDGSKGGGM